MLFSPFRGVLLTALFLSVVGGSHAGTRYHYTNEGSTGTAVRNSITGFVFSEDRSPVGNIYVELQTDMYLTVGRTQTNGAGMYSFRGLAAGVYVVKVLTGGTNFEEQSRTVPLVPISALPGSGAQSEQADFYLRPRRSSEPARAAPGVVFVQEVPDAAKRLYDDGVAELERKNEAAGYTRLKEALETFPDYFLALDRLANEYLAKGYYPAAHILFTRAVAVNPKSVSSTVGLGLTEYRINRLEPSIELLNKAITLDKKNVAAHYWLGVALHAAKKLGEAVTALQAADKLSDGKFADVHWQLARVYNDQKKYKNAADSLEKYLLLKPDAENADQIRGIIKLLQEKAPVNI